MNTITALLEELSARGITLVADPPALHMKGPTAALTPDLIQNVREHKPEIIAELTAQQVQTDSALSPEVAWRVAAMRSQVPPAGPIPFLLARRDAQDAPGLCLSCGDPLGDGRRWRCRSCEEAAELALNQVREGVPAHE